MNGIFSIFTDVIKNKYLKFSGRARRKEYWSFLLAFIIIYIAICIVASIIASISNYIGAIIFGLVGLGVMAIILPSIALGFRRMQDCNKPGWFIFIPIYSLILALTEGTHGDNEYGTDPKAIENE